MIDWDSHGLAFRRLSRQRKISTAKLIHQLINTNRQNNLYYGDSTTCPCCKQIEESFLHVLSCSAVSAIAHRSSALSHLLSSLKQIGTPPKIITAFEHGFQHWMASSTRIHAPTAGQLGSTAALLTTAFHEQFHDIGWLHLQLGRLSKYWKTTYISLTPGSTLMSSQTWASSVIYLLWQYTHSLWHYRNTIVHEGNLSDQSTFLWNRLRDMTTSYYQQFSASPSFLLPRHHYLFTDRPLDQRLLQSYDQLTCWARSVTEARQVLLHHDTQLQGSLFPTHHSSQSSSSSYYPTETSTLTTETSLTDSGDSISNQSITSRSSLESEHTILSNPSSCPTIVSWSTYG
jgi:hypothetical protein